MTQPFVKVIAGIANTDWADSQAVVEAAEAAHQQSGGTIALDVAASVTAQARQQFNGVLFASSVVPTELADAANNGADVVELGNYDALYEQGEFYTAQQVAALAKETVALVNGKAKVCVTIPGHLDTDSQKALAEDCKSMGVSYLQTEGAARLLSDKQTVAALSAEEKAELTMNNAKAIAGILPVIIASGITNENIVDMVATGAAGAGVGQYIRRQADMTAAIVELDHATQQPAVAFAS